MKKKIARWNRNFNPLWEALISEASISWQELKILNSWNFKSWILDTSLRFHFLYPLQKWHFLLKKLSFRYHFPFNHLIGNLHYGKLHFLYGNLHESETFDAFTFDWMEHIRSATLKTGREKTCIVRYKKRFQDVFKDKN